MTSPTQPGADGYGLVDRARVGAGRDDLTVRTAVTNGSDGTEVRVKDDVEVVCIDPLRLDELGSHGPSLAASAPGADGYVEAECRAAEAHGTFAVPRFTPAVEQPPGRVRRIGLVRAEGGWRFDVETLEELGMVPEACEVAPGSDAGLQTGSYASGVLPGRTGTIQPDVALGKRHSDIEEGA